MNKMREKLEQEQICLETKATIDFLRTKLMQIEDFKETKQTEKFLKNLKQVIDEIYWDL